MSLSEVHEKKFCFSVKINSLQNTALNSSTIVGMEQQISLTGLRHFYLI